MTPTVRNGSRRRRIAWGTASLVALSLVGVAWTLASPVGSSPDDDFHLATIWCLADAPNLCRRTGRELEEGVERVLVVPALGSGKPCFFMQPEVSAACRVRAAEGSSLIPSRANDGLYPNGFYRLLAPFASGNVDRSVVVMRMASWLLVQSLLFAALAVAGTELRRAFALAFLVTLIPMGVFLFASTNPSGLAIAGVAVYWCAALTFLDRDHGRRAVAAAGLALLAASLALGSRADAGLFLAVASVAAWISGAGFHRPRRRSILPVSVGAVGLLLTATGAGQSRRWAGELGIEEENSLAAKVFEALLDVPGRVLGSLGLSELGWRDTPMPALTSVLMVLAFGAAVALGLAVTTREKWFALATVATATIALPMVVLVSGQNVHPRYLLPLLPVLAGTALVAPRGRAGISITRGQAALVLSAVAVAHAAALHSTIRRYVTGIDEGGPDLGEGREWWWTTGPGPMAVWLLGSLAFGAAVVCGASLVRDDQASA